MLDALFEYIENAQLAQQQLIYTNSSAKVKMRARNEEFVVEKTNTSVLIQLQGARPSQQDTVGKDRISLHQGTAFTPKVRSLFFSMVLKKTVAKLQARLTQRKFIYEDEDNTYDLPVAQLSGSTATISLCDQGDIYTATVGDSPAFLLTSQTIQQLHIIHHPCPHTNPQEHSSINKQYLTSHDTWRVSGLAVSRALGDTHYSGVLHHPQITKTKIISGAHLLQGSDGMTDILSPHRLHQIYQSHHTSENRAMAIANDVLKSGAHDNTCIQISSAQDGEVFFVFDGHGEYGHIVSDFLKNNVMQCLEEAIAEECNNSCYYLLNDEPLEILENLFNYLMLTNKNRLITESIRSEINIALEKNTGWIISEKLAREASLNAATVNAAFASIQQRLYFAKKIDTYRQNLNLDLSLDVTVNDLLIALVKDLHKNETHIDGKSTLEIAENLFVDLKEIHKDPRNVDKIHDFYLSYGMSFKQSPRLQLALKLFLTAALCAGIATLAFFLLPVELVSFAILTTVISVFAIAQVSKHHFDNMYDYVVTAKKSFQTITTAPLKYAYNAMYAKEKSVQSNITDALHKKHH